MYSKVIFLVGMPRSGTSWLSQIVDSCPPVRFRLAPLFSYAFKNAVDERSDRADYDRVLRGAYASDDPFMNQTEKRRSGDYPSFAEKSAAPEFLVVKETRFHHLLERLLELFDDLKLVAIVRHPCGAIHSWLTTPKEFPATADPMTEWRSGACRKTAREEYWGFEDWKTVTRLHLALERRHPERVRVIRYEALVAEAEAQTRPLFAFLGLPLTKQTADFLAASQTTHRAETHAVFKHPSVTERWRSELDPDIQRVILEELRGTDLERFLA